MDLNLGHPDLVSGHRYLVSGHLDLVSGHQYLVSIHLDLVTGNLLLDGPLEDLDSAWEDLEDLASADCQAWAAWGFLSHVTQKRMYYTNQRISASTPLEHQYNTPRRSAGPTAGISKYLIYIL